MTIKKIPQHITNRGFHYKLMERVENFAIYQMHLKFKTKRDKIIEFQTHKILKFPGGRL